jgi:hypothetical protein
MLRVLSLWYFKHPLPVRKFASPYLKYKVLKSIDLAAIKFPVIIAENNGGSDALQTYLQTLG